ncbi:MAG TPA: NRDE family protein [Chitinophagaceae bacterium]|jgi:hypothetical protein
MCTVTYIPAGEKKFITSNRDEKTFRKKALPPQSYLHDGIRLIYPKDSEAGGSWIALNENGNVAVLLNGGFEKHISEPPYKKSRGLVFLDIIKHTSPAKYFLNVDLLKIEPFTVIIFEQHKLFECRWTGVEKICKELDQLKPHIWSSVTLYNEDIRRQREQWFEQWLNKHPYPDEKDILQFHQFAGDGNKSTDLVMKRGELYHTVSITSIELESKSRRICYCDLNSNEMYYLQNKNIDCGFISE